MFATRTGAVTAGRVGRLVDDEATIPDEPPPPVALVPEAPVLSGTAGNTVANLSWTAPYDGGSAITTYELERLGSDSIAVTSHPDGTVDNASSLTFSGTATGSNRCLVVALGHRHASVLRTVSSVTFNGDALTRVTSANRTSSFMGSELWAMVAPDATTGNIVITLSGVADICATAVFMTGVAQTSTFGTAATEQATLANPDLTLTSSTGELVVDSYAGTTTGAIVVGSGQTERGNQASTTSGQIVRHGCSTEVGAVSVNMGWTRDADNYALCAIPVKPADAGGATEIYAALAPRSYTDTGRSNGTTYQYRVKAVNAVGDGALSNLVSVVPQSPVEVPAAPVLSATAGDTTASLSWTEPNNGGATITSYQLQRDGVTVQAALPASPRSFVDTGRTNLTTYTYRVRAVNAAGSGALSTAVNVTPTAPSNTGGPTLPANASVGRPAKDLGFWGGFAIGVNPTPASVAAWVPTLGFNKIYVRMNGSGYLPGFSGAGGYNPAGGQHLVAADANGAPYAGDGRYDWQRDYYQRTGPYQAKRNGTPIEVGHFVKVHKPRDNTYTAPNVGGDLGPFGGSWDDDSHWATVCSVTTTFIQGATYLGASIFNLDPEFGTWDYPPQGSRTLEQQRQRIVQRGYEWGTALMEGNPNAKYSHYGTPMLGSWHSEVNTKNENTLSGHTGYAGDYFRSATAANEAPPWNRHGSPSGVFTPWTPVNNAWEYNEPYNAWQHRNFYRGVWKAMAELAVNATWTFQDAFWYHAAVQYPGLGMTDAMRWGLWGLFSWLSRDHEMSQATKNWVMRHFYWSPVSWVVTDAGNGYFTTQLREGEDGRTGFGALHETFRIWGMGGLRVEYGNGIDHPSAFCANDPVTSGSGASRGRPLSIHYGRNPYTGALNPSISAKTGVLGPNPAGGGSAGQTITYTHAGAAATPTDWTHRYVPVSGRATKMLNATNGASIGTAPPTITNLAATLTGSNVSVSCRVTHSHAPWHVAVYRGSTFNPANPEASFLGVMSMVFQPNNGTNLPPAGLANAYMQCSYTSTAGGFSSGSWVVVKAMSTKEDVAWSRVQIPGGTAYVEPGEVGFTGSESSLTLVNSAGTAPPGTTYASGYLTVNTNGLTLDGYKIVGGLYSEATSLTVTNCVVQGGASWFIVQMANGGTFTAEDSTFRWSTGIVNPGADGSGVISSGSAFTQTLTRCDISGNGDGVKSDAGNGLTTITDCYIHGLSKIPGTTHNDAIHHKSGDMNVTGCYIDTGTPVSGTDNSCIFSQTQGDIAVDRVIITNTYLNGGGYQYYAENGTHSLRNVTHGSQKLFANIQITPPATSIA
jgi:hypothetical protein